MTPENVENRIRWHEEAATHWRTAYGPANSTAREHEADATLLRALLTERRGLQKQLSELQSAAAKAVNYESEYQKPLTVRLAQLADKHEAALDTALRKGAEVMREMAASRCRSLRSPDYFHGDPPDWVRAQIACEREIRAIPLPGEES